MMVAGLTCNTRAVSRIPTVPIALLAFRRRAMAHNIRALAVGAWSTCVIIVARYHTGGSVPLRHPSRMADQQLCNTFPKRNPGRRSMTSVLPRSTSPLMAPSCQRVSPATSVKEPPQQRCLSRPCAPALCRAAAAPPRRAGRPGARGEAGPAARREKCFKLPIRATHEHKEGLIIHAGFLRKQRESMRSSHTCRLVRPEGDLPVPSSCTLL